MKVDALSRTDRDVQPTFVSDDGCRVYLRVDARDEDGGTDSKSYVARRKR